ncbi:MAG: hypothetical protein FJ344_06600 [Sphingomonadales bacterium]|nr:hypothetical protein [Sphingomonadales bacterium]
MAISLCHITASAQWSQSYAVGSGGHFIFQNLPNGVYRLTAQTGMAPGGVTAADAHLIFQSFANPSLLGGLARKAADGNGDGVVNISDASLVLQHSLQSPSANLATDYVTDTVLLALQDSNESRSVRVLSCGDVNRSFQPAQRLSNGLIFEEDPNGWPSTYPYVVLPVRVSRSLSLGSFQCFTLLPPGARVLSVRSPFIEEDVSFIQSNDTLRLGWYSTKGAVEVLAGSALWEMTFDQPAHLFSDFQWITLPGSEWANGSAQPQEPITLYIPRSRAKQSSGDLRVFPNPTSGLFRMHFDLEQTGRVRITLHEASGRLVELLQESEVHAGPYEALADISPRQPGVYLVQMEFTSLAGVRMSRSRLIVSR